MEDCLRPSGAYFAHNSKQTWLPSISAYSLSSNLTYYKTTYTERAKKTHTHFKKGKCINMAILNVC